MPSVSDLEQPRTIVHVMRHGEVHNPDGVLYGRLPDYHLSELGLEMANMVADYLAHNDITYVVASPLERAQETAAPIAASHDLPIHTDARVIESANFFEGAQFAKRNLANPRLINPMKPSWGEPYREIADRMFAAVADARDAARGHEAVIVSHQLPVWTLRSALVGQRLWHDPRKRECTLASLTSLAYLGDTLESVAYSEPAKSLLARASKVAGA